MLKKEPASLIRFSAVEYETVREFFKYKNAKEKYLERQRFSMKNNAGFFPVDDYHLTRFSCELLEITKHLDVLGCWGRKFEETICENFLADKTKLVHLCCFDPMNYKNPWAEALTNLKVLVIHPFTKTIEQQYQKRELLFNNPKIFPKIKLITYKPVQTAGDNIAGYATWFEALNHMKQDIKNIDFDVALIGAGAYGIFLADYCKEIGRIGVHMGGNIQVMFGIKGARWDNFNIYNEYWVRPSEDEKTLGFEKIEGGCYW